MIEADLIFSTQRTGFVMCKHGTVIQTEVEIPARLSHTGKAYTKLANIDSCIQPMVVALNKAGFTTEASCCGHGNIAGLIALKDGRELIIAKDWDESRRIINTCFNCNIHGEKKIVSSTENIICPDCKAEMWKSHLIVDGEAVSTVWHCKCPVPHNIVHSARQDNETS